jgi:hypothetical protein
VKYNYVKNSNNECVLYPGKPLPNDDSCKNGEDYWYERMAYRLIPYSSCMDGISHHRRIRGSWRILLVVCHPDTFRIHCARWILLLPSAASGHARGLVASLVIPLLILILAYILAEHPFARRRKNSVQERIRLYEYTSLCPMVRDCSCGYSMGTGGFADRQPGLPVTSGI